MLKLYGLSISNYYNIAKLALLEKGLDFEEVPARPGSPEFLTLNPTGKIPALGTEHGILCESQAILVYLERLKPEPALYPADPFQAGLAQQLHNFVDLYLDGSVRPLIGAAYFGAQATEETLDTARAALEEGLEAFSKCAKFEPYLAGSDLTHADLAAVNTFGLVIDMAKRLELPNPLEKLPALGDYLKMMHERPTVLKIESDRKAAMASLLAQSGSAQ